MEEKRRAHFNMSLRMTPANGKLLEALAKKRGYSKTQVLVMAMQDLAEKWGVPIPEDREEENATDE
jgi:hypothetical protein